jgi:hypothetical protein
MLWIAFIGDLEFIELCQIAKSGRFKGQLNFGPDSPAPPTRAGVSIQTSCVKIHPIVVRDYVESRSARVPPLDQGCPQLAPR